MDRAGRQAVAQIERLGAENITRIKADAEAQELVLKEELLARAKEALRGHVQIAMSVLTSTAETSAASLTEGLRSEVSEELQKAMAAEQKERASEVIKGLRFGPENKDYFWINDMHPRMVMHPYKPELDGADLTENKDPNGKHLFVEFVKVCREKGEGFVDYHWPKYGADEPQPKLSFVKLFKDWDWVIGTGVYIDDIDALVAQKRSALKKKVIVATGELGDQVEAAKTEIRENIRHVLIMIGAVTLGILALVLIASLVFTRRSITRPVKQIIDGINEGAEQVASASRQVSSASQHLAEGASEQAASIEETSSSLEEMASMTKQNAENAQQADTYMKAADQVVGSANESMGRLITSMED
ncbi:MAG: methyl-accepting chemotaxis protein, partial [Deltaproteobacteria bacterium]|nr:methyl-accepting chemotaxis protein [Deltaproteobacteria bacterium]